MEIAQYQYIAYPWDPRLMQKGRKVEETRQLALPASLSHNLSFASFHPLARIPGHLVSSPPSPPEICSIFHLALRLLNSPVTSYTCDDLFPSPCLLLPPSFATFLVIPAGKSCSCGGCCCCCFTTTSAPAAPRDPQSPKLRLQLLETATPPAISPPLPPPRPRVNTTDVHYLSILGRYNGV